MTLKEKFEMEIKNKGNSEILLKYKCSQIADDYAIEFAEWIEELSGSHIDSLDYYLYLDNDVKELLEIFKKEKGL
jgi:hypothetical protein